MPKRKYAHIKEIEPELLAMRNAGCTRQEIADHFGLEKIRLKIGSAVITVHKIGLQLACRPSTVVATRKDAPPASIAEYQYEIERVKMENQLLRDFLQSVGRK